MKRSIALALLLLASCGGDSAVDIDVTWSLESSGQTMTCDDAGAVEIRFAITPETPALDENGEPISLGQNFPCAFEAATLALDPGRYTVSASLHSNMATDGDDVELGAIATSGTEVLDLRDGAAAAELSFDFEL